MSKKFFTFIIAACCIAHIALAQNGSYTEETVVREAPKAQRQLYCGSFDRPIRVAGYMNYPPFGWKEESNDELRHAYYYGIGAEVFKKFAEELDLRYEFVNMLNYNEAKYLLTRGYFDILLNSRYDANSYSSFAYFYPAYITNPIVIVYLKPTQTEQPQQNTQPVNKTPETLNDLAGKKGLVRAEEDLFEMIVPKLPADVKLDKVNGVKRAFQALLRKEVDFLLMSQYAYETEVRRFKIKDFLTYSKTPVLTPVMFMSYAQGNQCAAFIKNALEQKLAQYSANKTLMKSILAQQLIKWENKFINEKSLMYQTDIVEEEVIEETKDLDAWLQQQQKKKEEPKPDAQENEQPAAIEVGPLPNTTP